MKRPPAHEVRSLEGNGKIPLMALLFALALGIIVPIVVVAVVAVLMEAA